MARRKQRTNDRYGDYGAYSTPRETRGGIKAHSKRGAFGSSWWAKRWIEVLERFEVGARLTRGRAYARKGQVTAIEITKGKVEAKVQGSMRTPYKVTIQVTQLTRAEWEKVGEALTARAAFAAKLLAGEMPDHIGDVFTEAGLSLFPERGSDLKTDCSCPDWSNPCKHVAAVYYLLGEAFDGDPFLIFQLRGLGRDELDELIGRSPLLRSAPEFAPEPLPSNELFWGKPPAPMARAAQLATAAGGLPKQLGPFPYWRGERPLLERLEEIYGQVSTELGEADP